MTRPGAFTAAVCLTLCCHSETTVPKTINDFTPGELEFQMFVLDELADEQLEMGKDVLKLQ